MYCRGYCAVSCQSKIDMLEQAKAVAIAAEDYDEAKKLKGQIDELKQAKEKVMINLKNDLPVNYVAGKRVLKTSKGSQIETDIVFFCMGLEYNNSSLKAFEKSMEKGRLKVDGHLRVEGHDNIFAIGDISACEAPMGYYAMEQGKYLANLFHKTLPMKNYFAPKGTVKPYKPQPPASIVSIGKKAGVCQLPITAKGKVFGSTTAVMIKSKDLFTSANWSGLNQNRKTKVAKDGSSEEQIVSLAAAMSITEENAKSIKAGALPQLEERSAFHA